MSHWMSFDFTRRLCWEGFFTQFRGSFFDISAMTSTIILGTRTGLSQPLSPEHDCGCCSQVLVPLQDPHMIEHYRILPAFLFRPSHMTRFSQGLRNQVSWYYAKWRSPVSRSVKCLAHTNHHDVGYILVFSCTHAVQPRYRKTRHDRLSLHERLQSNAQLACADVTKFLHGKNDHDFCSWQTGFRYAAQHHLIPKEGGECVVVSEDALGRIGISFMKVWAHGSVGSLSPCSFMKIWALWSVGSLRLRSLSKT